MRLYPDYVQLFFIIALVVLGIIALLNTRRPKKHIEIDDRYDQTQFDNHKSGFGASIILILFGLCGVLYGVILFFVMKK